MKKINKEEKDKILLDFISQKINEITEKAKEEERERIVENKKCNCGIEYDERGYPIEITCEKHLKEQEEKLKKIYEKRK